MEEETTAPGEETEAPKPPKVKITLEFDPETKQIGVASDPPNLSPLFVQGLCLSVCAGLNDAAEDERNRMIQRIMQDQQASAAPGLILATESDLPPGMNLQRGGIIA